MSDLLGTSDPSVSFASPSGFIEEILLKHVQVPDICASYPAMLRRGDRLAYFAAAKHFYRFQGLVVDAGVFLGGTTKCLVEGIKANRAFQEGKARKVIKAYDRFLVDGEVYARFLKGKLGYERHLGDSFRDVFDRLMEGDKAFVDLHPGDILTMSWTFDSFIEILGLDVCKGDELTAHTARMFFPHLRPYQSLLINQDYVFERQPQIAVLMEALSDHFVKLAELDCSGVFLCTKELLPAQVEVAVGRMSDREEALGLMQSAVDKATSPRARFTLSMGYARLAADRGDRQRASAILSDFVAAGAQARGWPDAMLADTVSYVETSESPAE